MAKAATPEARRAGRRFWGAFWSVILILAGIYGYAQWTRYQQVMRTAEQAEEADKASTLETYTREWVKAVPQLKALYKFQIGLKARDEIHHAIDKQIDAAFVPVYGQIEKFTDFHYSLRGEYTELALALVGDSSSSLKRYLFDDIHFQERLDKATSQLNDTAAGIVAKSLTSVRDKLQQTMHLNNDETNVLSGAFALSIDDVKSRFNSQLTALRAGGAVAGVVLASKLAAKKLGEKLAIKMAAKGAAKTAAKVATPGTAAGTGALACSWLGPIGMATCGAVAAGVAWFATDEVILKIDEAINRKSFEAQLHELVDKQKADYKAELEKNYDGLLDALSTKFNQKLDQTTPRDLIMGTSGAKNGGTETKPATPPVTGSTETNP